jgi:ubiquinone/menaquinone biosynthesis C-methylase UbiE
MDRVHQTAAGARVLEIGCGTGSGLVALAERGAQVVGLDLDESSLEVARRRCSMHGVVADLHVANANCMAGCFARQIVRHNHLLCISRTHGA